MDLKKFFKSGLLTGELELEYIQSLRDESQKQFNQLSANWATIQEFYDGNQWGSRLPGDGKDTLLTNFNGKPLYGTAADLMRSTTNKSGKMPLRTVNKIKNYIEALVASFVEVDPQPHALSASDYYSNPDIIRKADLWYDVVFNKENEIKHLYENATRKALLRTYSIYQVVIDENHAKTEIPVKFRYVDNMNFRVDPLAISLDEADYIIHTIQMRYKDLKENYEYVWKKLSEEEPEDFSMVTLEMFWIRFRDKAYSTDNPESKWLQIPVYDEQKLNIKKNGKVYDGQAYYVYKTLPYVMFKTMSNEYWHCEQSIVCDAIEPQIDYNKTISERDYNWNKFVDPVVIGTPNADAIEKGNIPGGYIPKKTTDVIDFINTQLIDSGSINNRLETVDNEIAEVFGTSKEIMQGRKPAGTYSDKLMQTLIQLSQLKPKRMEGYFLDAIKQLADKAMILWSEYMGSKSIMLWDSDWTKEDEQGNIVEYGRMVKIDPTTIRSVLYTTDVSVSDANLLTPETKFKNLTDLMQYGGDALKGMVGYEYIIFEMANNFEHGLVPDKILTPLRLMFSASIKSKLKELGITQGGTMKPIQNSTAVSDEFTNIRNELIQEGMYKQLQTQLGENFLEEIIQNGKVPASLTRKLLWTCKRLEIN
ncbi:MAG: hypothetical protein WC375_07510 [Methanomassiliicoccales archaeon]|jgi:uncharacterized protein (UPF0335 family)